jgi:hypothetical protein
LFHNETTICEINPRFAVTHVLTARRENLSGRWHWGCHGADGGSPSGSFIKDLLFRFWSGNTGAEIDANVVDDQSLQIVLIEDTSAERGLHLIGRKCNP